MLFGGVLIGTPLAACAALTVFAISFIIAAELSCFRAARPFKFIKLTELESTGVREGRCSLQTDVRDLAFSCCVAFGFPYSKSSFGRFG
jgi:hypothetical protein